MMAKFAKAYENRPSDTWRNVFVVSAVIIMCIFVIFRLYPAEDASPEYSYEAVGKENEETILAATWNIAAVNNNPFEYWITNDDPTYNIMMKNVSDFIEHPGAKDVNVVDVFTPKMYGELQQLMVDAKWSGLNVTNKYWNTDFKNRKIITGFIGDGMLGKKRLASMPDRVTNTINTASGLVMRPTVINCYMEGDLGSMDAWWSQWKEFFFEKKLSMRKGEEEAQSVLVRDMLNPIKKAKYPDVTTEEEQISIPLQTLAMAIFDAILVHMMNELAPGKWQTLRADICQKLNLQKNDRTVDILAHTYGDSDVIFLQEVAGNFPQFAAKKQIAQLYDIKQAASMDPDRDQNSFILLKKNKYKFLKEVTSEVIDDYAERQSTSEKKVALPVVAGDLIAILVVDIVENSKFILASFHGDTNGLATKPVVTAVRDYAVNKQPDSHLLFGLDANTYAHPEKDQQGVVDFGKFYTGLKLNSCYGPSPNPLNFTTFHARTHLQTQLNKAVALEDKDKLGDKNPKDFILFFAPDYEVLSTSKDNTGEKRYVDGMVFPTLSFPSDHGVTSTVLRIKRDSDGQAGKPAVKAAERRLRDRARA